MAEFLKFKESQNIWNKINESEHEYISGKKHIYIEEIKLKGEFIDQDHLLKELEISQDEI